MLDLELFIIKAMSINKDGHGFLTVIKFKI